MFSGRAAFLAAALVCVSTVNANAVPAFVADDVELLWGPEEDYPVKTLIPAGTELDVESCTDLWCFVRLGGYEGFVPRIFLNFLSPEPAPYLSAYPGYYSNGGYVYGPSFNFLRFGGNYNRRPYRNYPDWRQRDWRSNQQNWQQNRQNWQQKNWQQNNQQNWQQRNWQQNNQQRNWQQNNQPNWQQQQQNWQQRNLQQQNNQQNFQQKNWQQNNSQQNNQQRNFQQNNQQHQHKNWQQNNQNNQQRSIQQNNNPQPRSNSNNNNNNNNNSQNRKRGNDR